jgi:hypothetical protein
MKALLGALMCLVFTITQSFAISGGPFSGGGHVVVTGTYAGVFVAAPVADNSIALFTLKITQTGIGTGSAIIFRNGLFYTDGTINAIGDPDTAKLSGVISASFIETPIVGTTTVEREYDAAGKFEGAKLLNRATTLLSSSTRIKGNASITYRNNASDPNGSSNVPPCAAFPAPPCPIIYKVKGFKQSESFE